MFFRNQMNKGKMTVNVSLLVRNQAESEMYLKDVILNINVKKSMKPKTFLKIVHIFILMLLCTLLFTCATMLLQLQKLEAQVCSHMLLCPDKNNQNNPARLKRSVNYNDFVNPIVPSAFNLSNQTEIRDDRHTAITLNEIVSDRSTYHENNTIERNASFSDDAKSPTKMAAHLFFDLNKRLNYTTMGGEISNDHRMITWNELHAKRLGIMKRSSEEQQSEEKDETLRQNGKERKMRQSEENEETQRQSGEKDEMQRSEEKNKTRRKTRQGERKGEKRRQNRRGHKRNRKRSRPLIATFVGAAPEQIFNKGNGYVIGPWVKSKIDNPKYDFTKFHLVENNMSIEVGINGLYMISVQVYYFGRLETNSYWISLNPEGASKPKKLITCATYSREESCYTSTVVYLQKGDRLFLEQQEMIRTANIREGYSQIQIMLLANDGRCST